MILCSQVNRQAYARLVTDRWSVQEDLETCRAAGEDSLPRPTPHVRHPPPESRCTPQVCPRASGTRHHLDHLGHLFSRATRNGRSDRGSHGERPRLTGCSTVAVNCPGHHARASLCSPVSPANLPFYSVGAVGLEPTLYGF